MAGKLEQVRATDEERILVVPSFRVQGKQVGLPYEQRMRIVTTVRDRRIARTETRSSPEEALEAAGASG